VARQECQSQTLDDPRRRPTPPRACPRPLHAPSGLIECTRLVGRDLSSVCGALRRLRRPRRPKRSTTGPCGATPKGHRTPRSGPQSRNGSYGASATPPCCSFAHLSPEPSEARFLGSKWRKNARYAHTWLIQPVEFVLVLVHVLNKPFAYNWIKKKICDAASAARFCLITPTPVWTTGSQVCPQSLSSCGALQTHDITLGIQPLQPGALLEPRTGIHWVELPHAWFQEQHPAPALLATLATYSRWRRRARTSAWSWRRRRRRRLESATTS